MAIYRTGQASMDAQGYITGYDTKWREQLSLIRPGATIFFIDAPFQAAVISEVISDTQIRAITTGGAEIARSNYIILLHDSITVDGLAQDVAETLRYYQSKETQIEEAIEFFKNFDLKTLQDLVNQIKGDAEKTATDRAATEQLKNDTQQIKDSAVAETNQIKADTDAIKSQTQQIKDSAVTETEAIKQEAFGARDQAELARDLAEQSKIAADSAKAGAETARDEARQWAQQVNPENLLHKDQNLNDIPDKEAARKVLRVQAVISNDPAIHSSPGDYNQFTNPQASYELRIANNGEWRVARNSDNSTSALSIGAGGTGAENVTQAKVNLQINRVIQNELFTLLTAPDNTRIVVANNNEIQFQNKDGVGFGLPVNAGGTGAQTVSQARNNFGIGETDTPVFRGIALDDKNGANSGILYLRNKNAEGVQISYSRIYNEIQGGVAKATIQVTREGGDTNYYQFDEAGNALNYNTITIGRGIGNALGSNSLVIGDTDTGFKWGGDGILQVHCNGRNVASYDSQNMHLNGLLSIWPVDNNANGVRVSGARTGGGNALIGGQIAAGGWEGWRDRACGLLVELPGDDAAANVFKVVRWGGDWAAGLDVVRYSAGGCEAHFNVRGAVYGFNDAGYASAVQWVNTSDIRLKANLKEIESAKEKVKSIKGYTYFKRNNLDEDEYSFYSEEAGVIAQDVQTVLPEAVYKISDSGYLGVSYGGVTALLVNAFNEMSDQVDKQQEEIEKLKSEIADLKAAVAALLNKPTTL
ncbi:lateral tail fiber protein [Changchunvirus paulsarasin]|uniref:Lateral tail fiber protein n=1 Tax=Escherichia phage PaulSarasin TaxID=2851973 RepID=A0AAE7VXX4_9CAUD|nr:lateral tail fiber protein [Escherichia phage PaulSarasin]